MDPSTTGSSQTLRRMARLAVALLFTGTSVCALAANGSTSQRYSVNASLSPNTSNAAASGGGLQLQSRLTPTHVDVPVQTGSQFALIARLAESPTTCYADTIFRNGFE